tara:strand:- start:7486 stop:7965 length:480 start_codon:yes stop_codon:yes gene_type:complete
MRKINKIIVHCSATSPEMDVDVPTIRRWHVEENGWSDIGYHYVITPDGMLHDGRPVSKSGAHTRGQNSNSIGICLVGGLKRHGDGSTEAEFNFTLKQLITLMQMYDTGFYSDGDTEESFGSYPWFGHRDFDNKKACPTFDVSEFVKHWRIIPALTTGKE